MSIASFWRSVRRIPPRQLARRLSLQCRRRFLMSPLGAPFRRTNRGPIPLADQPPGRLFPTRHEMVVQATDAPPQAILLGRSFDLQPPCDWSMISGDPASHLERLTVHYLEFIDELDAGPGLAVILDWIERNPPWQPDYWQTSWNSYGLSLRIPHLLAWIGRHRGSLTDEQLDQIARSAAEQIRFLLANLETDIRGNHLMKNIRCLLLASRYFEGPEAQQWKSVGTRMLFEELHDQFLSDGMHFELSPAYHCQVFADVLECAAVLDSADAARVIEIMRPAAQVIADLTHPDARISLFSDGGLHMARLPEECLSAYEQLGGVRPRARDRFGFADCGYYGRRSEDSLLLFDCGPSCADRLPAHGHGDLLAFEWDVQGKRVVVDAGVREYESGPERAWNRSTRAHNTVTVGNRDQCEFLSSFRVGYRAHATCTHAELSAEPFVVSGRYTARSSGQHIEHTREIRADDRSVTVRDAVTSRVSEPTVARLLLHHDCQVLELGRGDIRIISNNTSIRLQTDCDVRICQAKWSPDFGTEFQTVQLELKYGDSPCEGQFTLRVESGYE